MLGLFSGLDSTRQGTGLEPRTLVVEGVTRRQRIPSIILCVHSPRNFTLEVVAQDSLLTEDLWMLQTVSSLSKGCQRPGPSVHAWRCSLDTPGSWSWVNPLSCCSQLSPGTTATEVWVAGMVLLPQPHPREAQGLGRGWGLPGV